MASSCLFAKFMKLLLKKLGMRVVYSHSAFFFSEVRYTERFNVESHKSLRYSNSFLLQTLILIILYKYAY